MFYINQLNLCCICFVYIILVRLRVVLYKGKDTAYKQVMQIYFCLFGNLDDFYLGTWTIFAWELGQFLLGNLDNFHLGT